MGTETRDDTVNVLYDKHYKVKLNNPLMGTETCTVDFLRLLQQYKPLLN